MCIYIYPCDITRNKEYNYRMNWHNFNNINIITFPFIHDSTRKNILKKQCTAATSVFPPNPGHAHSRDGRSRRAHLRHGCVQKEQGAGLLKGTRSDRIINLVNDVQDTPLFRNSGFSRSTGTSFHVLSVTRSVTNIHSTDCSLLTHSVWILKYKSTEATALLYEF